MAYKKYSSKKKPTNPSSIGINKAMVFNVFSAFISICIFKLSEKNESFSEIFLFFNKFN